MKQYSMVFVLLLFIWVTGCTVDNSHPNDLENLPETNAIDELDEDLKETESDFIPLSGPDFTNFHFDITKYNTFIDDQSFYIDIDYVFSEDLYEKLLDGNRFIMTIQYPESVQEVIGEAQSEVIAAPDISEEKRSYSSRFPQKLPPDLDSSQMDLILNHDAYTLMIFNELGINVYTEHNIKYAPEVKPGESEITEFLD